MVHSKAPVNIIIDERGSAGGLLAIFIVSVVFIFGLFLMDFALLRTNIGKARNAVTAAGLAALAEINEEALAYNTVEIEAIAAETTFLIYLLENLDGLTDEGIEEFIVYNPSDLPAVCPRGVPINETSIHVVIPVTVDRPILKSIFGDTFSFKIHLDINNVLANT